MARRSTSVLVQLIAAIVFPIALLIFTILHCLYGAVLALISLLFAIYVRLQPATVIRVSADGEATVISGHYVFPTSILSVLAAGQAGDVPPTDIEGRAVVRKFLESYMRYTPTSADKSLSDALNMMTQNLRAYSLG